MHKLIISDKTVHKVNPDMVGLFFEDINFAADGGLYAEMLENRSFEAMNTKGVSRNYVISEDNLYAWSAAAGSDGVLEISSNMSISEKNPHYLRFTASKPGDGFTNKAYDGICLKKGMNYKVSFYAREVKYSEGDIEVKVVKEGKCYGASTVKFLPITPEPDGYKVMVGDCEAYEWKKYETELIAEDDVKGALFEISLTNTGAVEFDLVSMMPGDAVAGIFRKDLFEALKNLNPGFLRFPGGCIVEGTSIARRYRWKDTVGDLKDRKINTNLWASSGGNTSIAWEMPDSHYMQSYGLGFYEYFLLCELLSGPRRTCKPLPVLNIGVACQFRSYETVSIDDPRFDDYVLDALDLIEFANGPADSKWGSLRAAMGHPESFNLDLIAIGNEQWESRHVNVADRYRLFEKAIHDKYPEIKLLGTAGPFVKDHLYEMAWNVYREENAKRAKVADAPAFAYAVDEHYYMAPEWLFDNVAFYDEYPRDVFVFAGEYAAHDANLSNSVEAGLAEAAMMTGMERNGDLVKFASYAPLFNRIGHSHWTPDMIWFDEDSVTLTPSYYVQKLFSEYAGDEAIELGGQEKALRADKLYVSAVKDTTTSKKIIKIVNANTEACKLELNDAEEKAFGGSARLTVMSAASGTAKAVKASEAIALDNNRAVSTDIMSNARLCELRAPEAVSCTSADVDLTGGITLPPKSFAVIVM